MRSLGGEAGRDARRSARVRDVLAACFALFTALLVWPLLSIPNRVTLIAGVPALVLYLFTVWAALVAVLAWAARRSVGDDGS